MGSVSDRKSLKKLRKYCSERGFCNPKKKHMIEFFLSNYEKEKITCLTNSLRIYCLSNRKSKTSNNYKKYINSEKWKSFRNKLIIQRGNKCEKCGVPGEFQKLQGHHLTYERLGNELPEDILIVCRDCHEKIHGRKFR